MTTSKEEFFASQITLIKKHVNDVFTFMIKWLDFRGENTMMKSTGNGGKVQAAKYGTSLKDS